MSESKDMFMDWIEFAWNWYPAFIEKPLLMTGEGYAGKFIARYSYAILDANTKLSITKYNLTASMIGNPFISPLTQRIQMHKLPEALNILDQSEMDQVATLNRRCQEEVLQDTSYNAVTTCGEIFEYVSQISGGVLPNDVRSFTYDWNPELQIVTDYFTNSTKVDDI